MKRFGLGGVSMLEEPNPEDSVERRKARAKRFGTKLVAAKGEPIKLVHRYMHCAVCSRTRGGPLNQPGTCVSCDCHVI